jgi:hypothetical protein
LFDKISEQQAEEWLERHGEDERAMLERFEKADDRIDGAFIRLVERQYALRGDGPPTDNAAASPLAKAVRDRQEGRVPQHLRDELKRLDALEPDYTFARGLAHPEDKQATHAALRALARKAR